MRNLLTGLAFSIATVNPLGPISPNAHAVDDVPGRAAVGLREIEIITASHLGQGEVGSRVCNIWSIQCRGMGDQGAPAVFGHGPILDACQRRNGAEAREQPVGAATIGKAPGKRHENPAALCRPAGAGWRNTGRAQLMTISDAELKRSANARIVGEGRGGGTGWHGSSAAAAVPTETSTTAMARSVLAAKRPRRSICN